MHLENLKASMGGVVGSFIAKKGEVAEVDLKGDLDFVMQSLLYLKEAVARKKDVAHLTVFGEKHSFSVYFYPELVIGVVLVPTANVQLLNLIVKRVVESIQKEKPPEAAPPTFEDIIPYFDRPKEEIIPNVPEYARQVLEYVDGTHTVGDIIRESKLPSEVVFDVVFSFRRTSVIHFK